MNKTNPYTQKAIERAIKAALACGLKVVAVRPDGMVFTAGDRPRGYSWDDVK